jgi:hypothetical protein
MDVLLSSLFGGLLPVIAGVNTTASGPEDDSGEYQWIGSEELVAQEMLEQELLEETMAEIQPKIAGTSTHHFLFSYFTVTQNEPLVWILSLLVWIVLNLFRYIRGWVARRGILAAARPRMGVAPMAPLISDGLQAVLGPQVRTAKLAQKLGQPIAFDSCIPSPTGMHGPTCIFWGNLTPFLASGTTGASASARLRNITLSKVL